MMIADGLLTKDFVLFVKFLFVLVTVFIFVFEYTLYGDIQSI